MKKKIYIIGILSFLLLCLSVGLLIHNGYLRDCYMDIDIPIFIEWGLWILLFVNFILFVSSVIYVTAKSVSQKEYRIFSKIMITAVLICFVGNAGFVCTYYNFAGSYKISGNIDYIENQWLEGISLEEMETLMTAFQDDIVVYIGREDCKDCKIFEESFIKILDKYSVITPTYFTNQDKDGENKEKLDKFLSLYQIESVPCVFYISNKKVVKKWEDPINSIAEIESCF